MAQYVYGLLHGVNEKKRLIAMKDKSKVNYYYMAKGLFQSFMQYFNEGIFVFMFVEETKRRYRGFLVQDVVNVEKVLSPHKQSPIVYYDVSIIKSGIESIMNTTKPKLFLDFEMSMPPYRDYTSFVSEIIQVGLILTDEFGEVISEKTTFIKPHLFPEISDRTKKFLHIEQQDIDEGMTYQDFYQMFSSLIQHYKPMVVVWGSNDQLELRKMNLMHNLYDFTPRTQFIDLLKLHKMYFGLKNDLGLFHAYQIYFHSESDFQKHDAYEDASITKSVFEAFLKVCQGKMQIEMNIEEPAKRENNHE